MTDSFSDFILPRKMGLFIYLFLPGGEKERKLRNLNTHKTSIDIPENDMGKNVYVKRMVNCLY